MKSLKPWLMIAVVALIAVAVASRVSFVRNLVYGAPNA